MKDKEPKVHPLVRLGSALGIISLTASQVGCKVSPATPEATSTGTSPALTVEPPVGFEPSTPTPEGTSTLPGAETPTPTESAVAAFRAPTLEELVVPVGEGGPLPEYAQDYYNVMDRAKADVVQKVGVDPGKVKIRYWDNTGSRDDFGWMLYYQIEGAGVIWPLKPDGTLADYSTYFGGQVQPDGSIVNLRINSDYNSWVVAGDKSTAAIFGGTLPVIVDLPKDANVAGETKLVYSRWLRPGGQPADYAKDFSQWQETSGILEPTSTPTETSNSSPTLELSPEQLAAKKLYGSGFELKTEFQGIPVDFTVVTSKSTLQQYNQTRGCFPNQEMKKYGASAEDRMAEMVFLGHYVGYLEDKGLTEENYPFEQYLTDLKAGRDRSYKTWGVRPGQSDGEFTINPLSPVEYVTTNAATDPDGNGRATALLPNNIRSLGFQQLENGGLRIVRNIGTNKNYLYLCLTASRELGYSLLSLGVPLEFLQGRIQLILPANYPRTEAKLDTDVIDMQIWKDSNGSLGPTILAP